MLVPLDTESRDGKENTWSAVNILGSSSLRIQKSWFSARYPVV